MTSEAAVTAIEALQKRIRDLEFDQQNIKDSIYSLHLQIDACDQRDDLSQLRLFKSTSRARQMIDNAAVTMARITAERELNAHLKCEIATCENILGEESEVGNTFKNRQIGNSVNDLEILIRDLFSLGWRSIATFYVSPANRRYLTRDSDLLPHPVRDVVERMRRLPGGYMGQPLPVKRAIIQGLICSVELHQKLSEQIHELQRRKSISQTPIRISFEIHSLVAQLFALEREINRISFA
jgi:hypothetical protein